MTKLVGAFERATNFTQRAWPIGTHLVALVIAALVPSLLFGAYAIRQVGSIEQAQYNQRLRQTADDLSADIDRAISGIIVTLRTLATAASLQRGDFAEFHESAKLSLDGTPFGLIVIEPSGQQRVNTLVPFGTPLPMTADPDTRARVLKSGTPQVSNLFLGALFKRPFLNVDVPVMQDGKLRYILAMTFEPSYIHEVLREQNLPPGWVSGVSDANGMVIARSAMHEQFLNTRLPEDLLSRRGERTVFTAKNLDGVPVMRAVSRLKHADWMVAATVPLVIAHAGSRAAQWTLALIGLSALALSLAVAHGMSKVLSGAVLDLSNTAQRLGSNEPVDAKPTLVSETVAVQAAMIEAHHKRLSAEDALRVTAEQLAVATRVAGVATSTINYDTPDREPIIQLSPEMKALLGLGPGSQNVAGSKIMDFVHPGDRGAVSHAFATAQASGGDGIVQIEHRIVRPDGTVVWLSVRATTFFDSTVPRRRPKLAVVAARDITDRRRMVDALRASEARYRGALLVGRIASWETNLVTRERFWSSEGRALFGLTLPNDVGTVGGPRDEYRNALHPDDRHLMQQFHQLAETEDEFAAEYRIRHPNGLDIWVSGRGHVIERDAAGKPVRILSVVADITDRKRAEDVLRANEARFRMLAEAIPNIAWTATAEGQLDWHSPRWAEYTGLTPGSLAEPNWHVPLHEQDHAATEAAWHAAVDACAPFQIEHRMRGKDGVYRWFVSRAVPVRDAGGAVIKWVGSETDIDANKRAQSVLARANAAADAAYDGLIGLTLDGRIESWNAGAKRLFGYTAEEVVGQSVAILAMAGDEADQTAALDTVRSGGLFGPIDAKRRHKTGRRVDVEISMTLVRDAGSHIIAISKVAHDISARLEAERLQHLMNRELSHRVKNTLAVLQSILGATLRSTPEPKAFAKAFSGRLHSMAKAQDLLTARDWTDGELSRLVSHQLSAHGAIPGGPIQVSGPEVIIPSDLAVSIGLVLHELATNAAKYGALSTSDGNVTLTWSSSQNDDGTTVHINWQEMGGPPVSEPKTKGFGSFLIDSGVPNSKVKREFLATGLSCRIDVQLPRAS